MATPHITDLNRLVTVLIPDHMAGFPIEAKEVKKYVVGLDHLSDEEIVGISANIISWFLVKFEIKAN